MKKFFDISVVNEKDGPKLKITDRFGRGKGLNQDPESALIRPYRKFLDDKSSIGSVKYICINENDDYILGSFVYTVTKRILFFPATKAKKIVRPMGNPIKKSDSNNLIENLDHITLEPNFRTWHAKLFDRETWYPTQQTREIDNSLFLWAQFQIKSLTELERLPERNEIYLEIPKEPIELASILPTIRDSRDNSIDVIPFDEKIDQPFFWVFQIFVSKSKEKTFPDLYPTRINHPPFVIVEENRTQQKISRTQIILEGFDGSIWIRTYKVLGRMTEGLFLMSGGGIPKKSIVPS